MLLILLARWSFIPFYAIRNKIKLVRPYVALEMSWLWHWKWAEIFDSFCGIGNELRFVIPYCLCCKIPDDTPKHTWFPDTHGEAHYSKCMLLAWIFFQMIGAYVLLRINMELWPDAHTHSIYIGSAVENDSNHLCPFFGQLNWKMKKNIYATSTFLRSTELK